MFLYEKKNVDVNLSLKVQYIHVSFRKWMKSHPAPRRMLARSVAVPVRAVVH